MMRLLPYQLVRAIKTNNYKDKSKKLNQITNTNLERY